VISFTDLAALTIANTMQSHERASWPSSSSVRWTPEW